MGVVFLGDEGGVWCWFLESHKEGAGYLFLVSSSLGFCFCGKDLSSFSFSCISSFSCIFSSINIFFFVSDKKKKKRKERGLVSSRISFLVGNVRKVKF